VVVAVVEEVHAYTSEWAIFHHCECVIVTGNGRPAQQMRSLYFAAVVCIILFPRLFTAVADWSDVYHTSTHDVALVRI